MTLDCSGIAKNLACSRRLDLGDSAKRREQKKENNEGVGQGCERGNACKTSYKLKARSGIPDSGIPYEWSILTALVSTKRFITLI